MSTNPPASEQPPPNPSGLAGSSEPAVRDIAEILVSHLEASTSRYSGPLPPPEVLENYDRIVPGAAKKIIAMALRQSRHRQELERKVIESDMRRSRDGLWVGGALSLTSILLGAVAVFYRARYGGGDHCYGNRGEPGGRLRLWHDLASQGARAASQGHDGDATPANSGRNAKKK